MPEFLTTERVQSQAEATNKLSGLIDSAGSEPLIKNTTIEAYRIAALTTGMSVEEILFDYPSLAEEQVFAAKAYADAYPKEGTPYPSMTAKKGMRMARDATAFLPKRK